MISIWVNGGKWQCVHPVQSPVADGEITTECLGPQFGVTSTSHQSPGTGYSVPTRQKLFDLYVCFDFMCVPLSWSDVARSVQGIDEIDLMEVTGSSYSPGFTYVSLSQTYRWRPWHQARKYCRAASDKGHVVAGAGARAGLRKTMLDGYQWRRYCVRSSERWKCHGIWI